MSESPVIVLFDGGGKVASWFCQQTLQLDPTARIVRDKAGLRSLKQLDELELFIGIAGANLPALVAALPELRADFPAALVVLVLPSGQGIDEALGDFIVNETFFPSPAQVQSALRNLFRQAEERKKLNMFSAMLIHDLRSPVQSIIGYLELLEQEVFGSINEGQKKILVNALSQGDVVSDLLEELALTFQLENRKYKLERLPMRPGQMIQEALRALWVLADQKNIKLTPQMPNDLPALKADSLSVSRVLHNLVNNAIKFTPIGGVVRVTVRRTHNTQKQPMLEFCIIDSGPGIPPEQMEHVFEKYYRLPREAQATKGQGLGLYICKLLVEAHGGKVGAYNNREGGSTFYFTLPMEDEN